MTLSHVLLWPAVSYSSASDSPKNLTQNAILVVIIPFFQGNFCLKYGFIALAFRFFYLLGTYWCIWSWFFVSGMKLESIWFEILEEELSDNLAKLFTIANCFVFKCKCNGSCYGWNKIGTIVTKEAGERENRGNLRWFF